MKRKDLGGGIIVNDVKKSTTGECVCGCREIMKRRDTHQESGVAMK